MCTIYGYCRISTAKQSIERQIDNIRREYPAAVIVSETFTGTTTDRPAWNKLYRNLKAGDTVVFDEVSRMSRNAEEAIVLYEDLFNQGITLVFLKEPHINTEVYKKALENQIAINLNTGNEATDNFIQGIIDALNRYTMELAKEQIKLAFAQAQAEVDHLHQRTVEGVRRAQMDGKRVGRAAGTVVETKKAKAAKQTILAHSKDFGGSLSDSEVMKLIGCSRNSYYKYKGEMKRG